MAKTKLTKIEGIGPVSAEKLQGAGIDSVEALLKAGKTKKGRDVLAKTSGLKPGDILGWLNRADLFRVKGIGEEYADLLEASGVDTVPALARRRPDNLHAKMLEVNAEKKLVRRPPTMSAVEKWVAQAKELPRVLEY